MMRHKLLTLLLLAAGVQLFSQNSYYFGDSVRFREGILSPGEFTGHAIGSFHTRYDLVTGYMNYLAKVSERVSIEQFGITPEKRPQVLLTITAPSNRARLEQIRMDHLALADPLRESSRGPADIPVVVQLGFNVHGNEASGGEASLLMAYYLAAATGDDIERVLESAVIFIEPVLNPDGRERFVSWVNQNGGINPSADPADREHNEAWPGGRTNHYWFDLNRDWMPLTQVESVNRVKRYHLWKPNLITDHHEMGTNSTFFFEPTKPGSENPLVPRENYDKLSRLFASSLEINLNRAGHYYDSGLSFDNSYPGYGSTYGDLHGGLALLFEQASTRGVTQETASGYEMPFALGIKNQLVAAISSLNSAVDNRVMLNEYMQRFFRSAVAEARESGLAGYLFGAGDDLNRTYGFAGLLMNHDINVYRVDENRVIDGNEFDAGVSFYVPADQPQYRMIRSVFETADKFSDSLFYDASAWSMVHAWGLPFAATKRAPGNISLFNGEIPEVIPPALGEYGYVFTWSDYNAPAMLTFLLENGVRAMSGRDPVTLLTPGGEKSFGSGVIFVPVNIQEAAAEKLHSLMIAASSYYKIPIYPVAGSATIKGPYLGNNQFVPVEKPAVLMFTGDGISSSSAGTTWHLLDTRCSMEFTRSDIARASRIDFGRYNVIILPSGSYSSVDQSFSENLRSWVRQGGTLIALGTAINYIKGIGLAEFTPAEVPTDHGRIDFGTIGQELGKHSIGGVYLTADLDNSHPLGFGYGTRNITLYKNNRLFINQVDSPTSNVVIYGKTPLVSGYLSEPNREVLPGLASVLHIQAGRGNVILFVDDPVFRGFWRGTDRMVLNAILLGSTL